MYKLDANNIVQAEIAAHDPAESVVIVEVRCWNQDGPREYVVIRDEISTGLSIVPSPDRDISLIPKITPCKIRWPGLRQEFVAAFPVGRESSPYDVEPWLAARGLIPQNPAAPVPLLTPPAPAALSPGPAVVNRGARADEIMSKVPGKTED